jgi:pyruvate/2-oxoglutarate dehydrogenase complex dihydrolipoamide acyltransferase (E2) component
MGMQEAQLKQWLKHEGDRIEIDEELAIMETDKAAQVVVAPSAGVLERIVVSEGETIPVDTVLAIIAS